MSWRKLILLGFGAFALSGAAAAIATAPARVFIPENARGIVVDASGTLWRGRTALRGGLVAGHAIAPLRSVVSGRLAFDVDLTGPQTQARLKAGLRPGSVRLSDIRGRSDMADLSALAPDFAVICEGAARLDLPLIEVSSGALRMNGEIDFAQGLCTNGGQTRAYPALMLNAEGARVRLLSASAHLLAVLVIEPGRASVTITQDGADILAPGRRGPFTLETDF